MFDPNKPFETVEENKGFDPNKPFESVEQPASETLEPYSKLESALLGASQGATMGFGEELLSGLKAGAAKLSGEKQDLSSLYDKYLQLERNKLQQAKEANPASFTAGDVVGSIGTALIPGAGIAKGASLAANVAKGAALGGIEALGRTEANKVSPESAVEVAKGASIGAVGGALAKGLENLLSPKTAANLSKESEQAAFKAFEPSQKQVEKQLKKADSTIGKTAKEVLSIFDDPEKVSNKINKAIDTIEQSKQPLLKESNQLLSKLDDATKSSLNMDIQNKLSNSLVSKTGELKAVGPDAIDKASSLYKYYGDELNKIGNNLEELNKFKSNLGKELGKAFDLSNADLSIKNDVQKDVYMNLKNHIEDIINKVNPGQGDAFKSLNNKESDLINLGKMAMSQTAKQMKAAPVIGLKDIAAGTLGSAISGSPLGVLGGIAIKKAAESVNKEALASKGLELASKAVEKASNVDLSTILSTAARPVRSQLIENTKYQEDPTVQAYNKAIEEGNNQKAAASEFSLLQNPKTRDMVKNK